MRILNPTKAYNKGFKKLKTSGNKVAVKNLKLTLQALKDESNLPPTLNPHMLHGRQGGMMSVWLQGTQWVLVFKLGPDAVDLICLGSHKECYESDIKTNSGLHSL